MKHLLTIIFLVISMGSTFAQTETIATARLKFALPNTEWKRNDKKYNNPNIICYERTSIRNEKGENIIPNITFIVESVPEDLDLVIYSSQKRSAHKTLDVKEVFTHNEKPQKIKYKYAVAYKGTYTDAGSREHTVYLIHLINKNTGVEIIMDITSDLIPKYEAEFSKCIKSIESY